MRPLIQFLIDLSRFWLGFRLICPGSGNDSDWRTNKTLIALEIVKIFRWLMSYTFITKKKRSIKSRSVLMLQSLTRTTLLFYLSSEFISQMGAHDIEDALIWKKKIELLIDQVQSVCNPFWGYDTIAANMKYVWRKAWISIAHFDKFFRSIKKLMILYYFCN